MSKVNKSDEPAAQSRLNDGVISKVNNPSVLCVLGIPDLNTAIKYTAVQAQSLFVAVK